MPTMSDDETPGNSAGPPSDLPAPVRRSNRFAPSLVWVVPLVAASVSVPPLPPSIAPAKVATPEASVKLSAPEPPVNVCMLLKVVVVFSVPVFVALIAQGHDTNAVAKQMFISPYTVQDHLKSIFDKLGVHSRLDLLTRLFAQAG